MGMDISGCMLPRKVIDVVRHDPSPYVPLGRLALEASPNCKPALAESVVRRVAEFRRDSSLMRPKLAKLA